MIRPRHNFTACSSAGGGTLQRVSNLPTFKLFLSFFPSGMVYVCVCVCVCVCVFGVCVVFVYM